jgi:hypothetical protein
MSKDDIIKTLTDPEFNLTDEWKQIVFKTYNALFDKHDSVFSQLKEFKTDVRKQLDKMSDHIGLIDMTINTYIQLDNDYKVKYAEKQQELEVERNRTQTERYWKIAIAIGAPILSILSTIIVTLIITKLLP